MLKYPFLAQCANRNSVPRSNQHTGLPEDWFSNTILNMYDMVGFSFDFFVDWSLSPNQITPNAWLKRILTDPPQNLTDQQVKEGLISFEGTEYLTLFAKFCNKNNLTLHYILFREVDWEKSPEIIFVVTIKYIDDDLDFHIERLDIEALQSKIRAFSGGAVRIGSKGLIYGTSCLECFLSKTDSLYPGDVDLIIVNKNDLEIHSILEFKKHNLDTPIESQKLGNYYPNPDRRKYDRLAILKNYLSAQKLFCVYYPTKSCLNGKIESIEGQVGSLVSGKTLLLPLPTANDQNSYSVFVKGTLDF